MKRWLTILFIGAISQWCLADDFFVLAPTSAGPVGGPYDTSMDVPFLIKQIPLISMRYQQVYNASLFTNVNPEFLYVTTLKFRMDKRGYPWTVTNIQINLSTTSKSADSLSQFFAFNVGADDTIVFGPGKQEFPQNDELVLILLDQPFHYDPAQGNLLLDVRVFDARGSYGWPENMFPRWMDAQNSPTDEVSSVWADSVTATLATQVNTVGLRTVFQFSSLPSLVIYTSTFNTPTNYFAIEWPGQPSVFVLQQSTRLGSNANWQTVTNATAPRYYFPVKSSSPADFYRLIWPSD